MHAAFYCERLKRVALLQPYYNSRITQGLHVDKPPKNTQKTTGEHINVDVILLFFISLLPTNVLAMCRQFSLSGPSLMSYFTELFISNSHASRVGAHVPFVIRCSL